MPFVGRVEASAGRFRVSFLCLCACKIEASNNFFAVLFSGLLSETSLV